MIAPSLALRAIRKSFSATVAVDGVDLDVMPGEIHALVGENGAGKSTLSAIAYGTLRPDAGIVERRGSVGLVHQHFSLIERLRVWENVVLGHEPHRGVRLDPSAARRNVAASAQRYGFDVDPDAYVETLPVAVRQRVELLRELAREPRVLILDEPTAALAPSEIDALFATVARLAAGGTAILVVTHKLSEVVDHSHRVTVMRAGTIVARMTTSQTTAAEIARAMVGGDLPALAPRASVERRPALRVRDLAAGAGAGAVRGCSFEVASGEIVGVAGIEGNGQSALADALSGTLRFEGTIERDARALVWPQTPATMAAAGIATIPQDRGREALVLDWTLEENVVLGRQRERAYRRGALVDARAARTLAEEIVARYDVRPPRTSARAATLSGGNQQKVVVGRILAARPPVVVAYGPTRGIDIGAATLVGSRLVEARNAGAAVLLVSFELDEIFALADRVIVMREGAIVASFARDDLDRARIGALMTGGA